MSQKLTFHGIVANLETSLLEYGLIMSNEKHEDGSGTQFVVYKMGDFGYGTGHISEEETNGYIEGKEWMSEQEIASFLSTEGTTKEEWLECSHALKLHSLINYYGYENIMGTDYSPITEKGAIKLYLK